MGTFTQLIEIGRSQTGPFRTVDALVDTGATYTWIPSDMLEKMGIQPQFDRPFIMADGRRVDRSMGRVHVRIDGREWTTPCIFGDPGTPALLGAVTLEELGFGVDPINRRLVETPGLLMGVQLRHRLVPASDPDADPECRLTREDGQRRQADTGRLFALLAEQRQTARGHEFVFRGDATTLWEEVTLFVDEESQCCPFFTYEQVEEADGVTLRVLNPPSPVAGP